MNSELQRDGLNPNIRADICGNLLGPHEDSATYRLGGVVFEGRLEVTRTESGLQFDYSGRQGSSIFLWDASENTLRSEPGEVPIDRPHFGDEIIARLRHSRRVSESEVDIEPVDASTRGNGSGELNLSGKVEEVLLNVAEFCRSVFEPNKLIEASPEQTSEARAILSSLTITGKEDAIQIECPGYPIEADPQVPCVNGKHVDITIRTWTEADACRLEIVIYKRWNDGDQDLVELAIPGLETLTLLDKRSGKTQTASREDEGCFSFKVPSDGQFTIKFEGN